MIFSGMTNHSNYTNHVSPGLIRAIRKTALDVGAGNFRDSVFLRDSGYQVEAIEPNPKSDPPEGVVLLPGAVEDFLLSDKKYDLINVQFVFHLLEDEVIVKLITHLTSHGILVGNFFSVDDEWVRSGAVQGKSMEQVKNLFESQKIISCEQACENHETMGGQMKTWQTIEVVVGGADY